MAAGALRGWPVVIDFCTWRDPCRDEAPVLAAAAEAHAGEVVFLASIGRLARQELEDGVRALEGRR